MYNQYFGLAEAPFSIAPDPRYLFLSEQHREALAHLLYGIGDQGGFIVLTGEVGTGKTTVCRCLLQQLPDNADVAFIVNPKLDSRELLQTICEELGVPLPDGELSIKQLVDALNDLLLATHARGRNAILIIDEAQNLDVDVLEQLRLLTNLETSERKLLQLILLGQPELNDLLARPDLRQLAQRITARYHLRPLSREEVALYIEHRLAIAGCRGSLFTPAAIQRIYRYSQGVPRLINLLCDRALLGVYAGSGNVVDTAMVRRAAREVLPQRAHWTHALTPRNLVQGAAIVSGALVLAVAIALYLHRPTTDESAASVELQAGTSIDWRASLTAQTATEAESLAVIRAQWPGVQPVTATGCEAMDTMWGCAQLTQQERADVERIDLPMLLWLTDGAGGSVPVALLALNGGDALVFFAGREWSIAWNELEMQWTGRLSVPLPAPVRALPLAPGAHDTLVGWVDERLYRHYHQNRPRWIADTIDDSKRFDDAAPKAAWLASTWLSLHAAAPQEVFDASLANELKRFQTERKLPASGVVDVATVIELGKLGGESSPRLHRSAEVAHDPVAGE
jgi:general secretion pathway protein A